MYFITYNQDNHTHVGVLNLQTQNIISLLSIGDAIGTPLPDSLIDFIAMADDSLLKHMADALPSLTDTSMPASSVTLLAPIPTPRRNIICLGKNYAEHASEVKSIPGLDGAPPSPIYFSKLPTTVVGPNAKVSAHAKVATKVDYEVELAIIIGKEGTNIKPENAADHIFGYTIANDITARDLQTKHLQWFRGKSLDGFCPMGPGILTRDSVAFPPDLAINCTVNGEPRQSSTTSHLIFDIPTILADLSAGITLQPGDIILTGTPAGVGIAMNPPQFLTAGDTVTCTIENIGTLTNTMC